MTAPSRWGRRLLRSSRLRRLLCWVIHLYIRFVYATNRWTVEGAEVPHRLRAEGKSFILAFWHGRLLMIPMAWQRLAPMHMLISAHRDGRIIADAVTHFGVQSIAGSTKRGGLAALRTMVKRLDAGDCVGITPDGPRGPATVASSGIVNLARLAGVPIVPIVFATSRRRVLRTWDRFHLALPFGRGAFIWGEPIEVAAALDAAGVEEARLLVERRMNELAAEADRHAGCDPSPAPREREGPAPPGSAQSSARGQAPAWEGEGLPGGDTLTGPRPRAAAPCGPSRGSPSGTLSRGAGEGFRP